MASWFYLFHQTCSIALLRIRASAMCKSVSSSPVLDISCWAVFFYAAGGAGSGFGNLLLMTRWPPATILPAWPRSGFYSLPGQPAHYLLTFLSEPLHPQRGARAIFR